MRFMYALAGVMFLSGCTTSNVRYGAVVEPTTLQSYAAVCSAVPPFDLTAAGYVQAGWDFVDEQCDTFFNNVILLQKDARYASSSIATANTQTAVILRAVESSATSIAIVAAGSELVRKLIDGFAAEYAFAPYALEVRRLVFDAMSKYRRDTEVDVIALASAQSRGDAFCRANNIVRNYAKLCTISGVEAFARQAIANSGVHRSDDDLPPLARRSVRRASDAQIASFRRSMGLPPRSGGLPNYVAGSR